ncbi:MAG TPA: SDR family oxidoreductase [Xanthobacteraceae bacterium]
MQDHPRRAALITGGAVRVGRAISLALAAAGYDVAIHTRTAGPEVHTFAAELTAGGVRSGIVTGDLSQLDCVGRIISAAAAKVGRLTLLVNNASEFESDAFGQLDLGRWQRQFAVNLAAPVFLAQAFAAQAPAGGDASIVNITDQRARKLVPQHFSYTLTKAALHSATVMMAQALAPRIRVNAVAPGPTLPSPRQDETAFARQAAALPLQRAASPQEIAAAVLYLASAGSVTGETITVDGGQHVAWKTPDVWGIDE